MPRPQGRKRSRIACQTCRELKRKCDGSEPCGTCVRFEYTCTYPDNPTSKKRRTLAEDPDETARSSPTLSRSLPAPGEHVASADTSTNYIRSLEANSGAAFLRRLALRLDPKDAPQLRTFAWNAFLGGRKTAFAPVPRPITGILSYITMQSLATVYFEKVDPIYGFVDRQAIEHQIGSRWTVQGAERSYDAVLCGIAALGCLFSSPEPVAVELDLVESARQILEQTLSDLPSVVAITAWVLRVAYLRIAETHHAAWMASCILMHVVESAGLHYEPPNGSVLSSPRESIDPEMQRRLVAVAQHLNIWMSFDMGHSRVTLCNATVAMPSARPGDYTVELMGLLPYSTELDPTRSPSAAELENALSAVFNRVHSLPPSVLAQCNLALCLYRRLQSMNATLTGTALEQLLSLTSKGIQAAQALLDGRAPWHHMANVPFQIVCVLLAMDTSTAISQLKEAMQCLRNVAQIYNTDATREALKTASLLILLQKRRKEKAALVLGNILEKYPVASHEETDMETQVQHHVDMTWLNSLADDLSSLPYFHSDQILGADVWKHDGIIRF